ncbi:MAG: GTPase domain-containing protein [Candidatus Lokiarchaeota archaeon]|nr:GTPase domain-containing protein [Candidatus Lokiarchaeota archaeon]
MIIYSSTKIIQIKIVYFGPAMSGKTTSLKYLMNYYGQEQNLRSIETTTGRTLVFDFGSITITGNDWKLKILLYSATGQDFYASTRPATVTNLDGIIFVADSQYAFLLDNTRSWNELFLYYGENFYQIPIVVCLNKRDLPSIVSEEQIISHFQLSKFLKFKLIPTIANQGRGVVTAFYNMLEFLFPFIPLTP